LSSTPQDPIFDFGLSFESSANRIRGERQRRAELTKRLLQYDVTFLDDCLRGILPNHLVIIGASTGAGKTELAQMIAMNNVRAGKRVHYFALEAEPDEIERRTKFKMLARMASEAQRSLIGFNYADWYLGRCDDIVGDFEDEAEEDMHRLYSGLKTYYRGSRFGFEDIKRLFLAVQSETDLIVLDHLHYIDVDEENENRGMKHAVKTIRDTSLAMGIPVILVVHLRKKDIRVKTLVPDLDQVHGSSDITKIATHTIMLAPARGDNVPSKGTAFANTFMSVPKDRMSGQSGIVALCRFDLRFRTYETTYTLGRAAGQGDFFEPLDLAEVPRWATNHRPLMQAMVAGENV
jgi:hypothetical protein